MLKISQSSIPNDPVTLKLEGRIIGPWVDELRQICESLLTDNRALKLDLADVSFVDAGGVAALNSFESRGVKLKNCSPFVEQQIKASN